MLNGAAQFTPSQIRGQRGEGKGTELFSPLLRFSVEEGEKEVLLMLSYLIQGTDEALYVGTGLLQRYYHFMANALDENVGSIQLLCSVTGLWGTLGLLHQLQNPDVLAK